MATLKTITPLTWAAENNTEAHHLNLWDKYLTFADSQASNRTLWFLISLMVQGVLFLPIPAVLIDYYNAPILVLAVTMICFFTNIIANMGGAGIRTTLTSFFATILIHIIMILVVVL